MLSLWLKWIPLFQFCCSQLHGANPNAVGKDGHTALKLSANNDYLGGIEDLLNVKGDINLQDMHGHTSLHFAARNGNYYNHH